MLKLRFSGIILATSGARATKCSKLLRWGLILLSFVASPMLDNCGPRREKHRKLRWYSGPASHPAPCWAPSGKPQIFHATFDVCNILVDKMGHWQTGWCVPLPGGLESFQDQPTAILIDGLAEAAPNRC